jgi:hypothetical protein
MYKGFSAKSFLALVVVLLLIATGLFLGKGLRTEAVMLEKPFAPQLTEVKE